MIWDYISNQAAKVNQSVATPQCRRQSNLKMANQPNLPDQLLADVILLH